MQRRPFLTSLLLILILRSPLTYTQGSDGVEMNPRLFTASHSPHTVPPGENRARIFKRLWSPGIDAKELIPPAYVAWRAGTITLFLLGP